MTAPSACFTRDCVEGWSHVRVVIGAEVRDWMLSEGEHTFYPYDESRKLVDFHSLPGQHRRLWAYRTELGNRATFSHGTYFSDGRPWHEWHQLPVDKDVHPWTITFAEVATHNNFTLNRGGTVFSRTAPVIKLSGSTRKDDYLQLLGVLNSSIACYWLKQACFPKGGSGMGRGIQPEDWMERFAFNTTNVMEFPLPSEFPLELGRALDALARPLSGVQPSAVLPCASRPASNWTGPAPSMTTSAAR